jgi:hypothetical protein
MASALLGLIAALAACSPELNWREVRLPSGRVSGMLPCKPDSATRAVELAGQVVQMVQSWCTVADATFVLAEATLPSAELVSPALSHWQQAVAQNVGLSGALVQRAPLPALPGAMAMQTQGQRPDGGTVHLWAVWGARGAQLAYAANYAPKALDASMRGQISEMLFQTLKVQAP